MWLGDSLLGMGPGRSKCDTLGAGRSPLLCPHGVETVFDGYDITQQLAACAGQSGDELERGGEDGGGGGGCELFIESYAFDQPAFNVTRRISACVALCSSASRDKSRRNLRTSLLRRASEGSGRSN